MLEGELPKVLDGHKLRPETLMTHAAYVPQWSENAAVVPMFANTTWLLESGESGERSFKAAQTGDMEKVGLIYSRINDPNMEILEKRLALLEGTEAGAVYASGMAAITTLCLALLRPDDIVLHTEPLYGGTNGVMKSMLPAFGIHTCGFEDDALEALPFLKNKKKGRVRMVFIETPANPTMKLVDIQEIVRKTRAHPRMCDALIVVDNTFLNPFGQRPLDHGADVVVHSLTKSIGGHGDLVGGAILGSETVIHEVRKWRSMLGSVLPPFSTWLCTQHLGTLELRTRMMAENAHMIAQFLAKHPKVKDKHVFYPGLFEGSARQVFEKQCLNTGHVISFEVYGGKKAAFRVLDNLSVIAHAVSLGGIKSLACHPASTTHYGVSREDKKKFGISNGLIRLSVGTENVKDLVWDLRHALARA